MKLVICLLICVGAVLPLAKADQYDGLPGPRKSYGSYSNHKDKKGYHAQAHFGAYKAPVYTAFDHHYGPHEAYGHNEYGIGHGPSYGHGGLGGYGSAGLAHSGAGLSHGQGHGLGHGLGYGLGHGLGHGAGYGKPKYGRSYGIKKDPGYHKQHGYFVHASPYKNKN